MLSIVGCSQRAVKKCGTPFYRKKHPLKLEGDEIGLMLLTKMIEVKSRFLVLKFAAIILCQVHVNTKKLRLKIWKSFLLDILLFQRLCEKRNISMKKKIINRGGKCSCYKWPVIWGQYRYCSCNNNILHWLQCQGHRKSTVATGVQWN